MLSVIRLVTGGGDLWWMVTSALDCSQVEDYVNCNQIVVQGGGAKRRYTHAVLLEDIEAIHRNDDKNILSSEY